jgi:hypothetical protein
MARSRTPSRKAAKPAASAVAAADNDFYIAVGILAVVAWRAGVTDLASFGAKATNGFQVAIPDVPVVGSIINHFVGNSVNVVLTLHVLNCVANGPSGGYWLNDFVQTLLQAFVAMILPAVLNGGNFVTAIVSDQTFGTGAVSVFEVFVAWYIIRTPAWIPLCPAEVDVWGKITASPIGGALEILMGLSTDILTLVLTINAVGGAHALFSTAWWQAVVMGLVVGSASSFFPLNKGFKLAENAGTFAVVVFIASNGFAGLDALGAKGVALIDVFFVDKFSVAKLIADTPIVGICNKVGGFVVAKFGGNAGFVVSVTVLNRLFGKYSPVPLGEGFDVFGVTQQVLERFKL